VERGFEKLPMSLILFCQTEYRTILSEEENMNITTDIKPVTCLKAKAADLLKLLAQGEEDIRNGNLRAQEEVFSDLERKLTEQKP
jgi:hypothetical protein